MTTATQQAHMFYQSASRVSERDQLFMELVKDGLTRHELRENMKRRPSLWERYRGWLDKLPA